MRRSRALHHLDAVVASASRLAAPGSIVTLPVRAVWAYGDLLDAGDELEDVHVAVVLDLPEDDVPLNLDPPGGQHWANASGAATRPVRILWRSAHAPVWNHRVRRPLLLWDLDTGRVDAAFDALAAGTAEDLRAPAAEDADLVRRLERERDVSLRALRNATTAYTERRWAPGRLDRVADPLWQISLGYVEVLDALEEVLRRR